MSVAAVVPVAPCVLQPVIVAVDTASRVMFARQVPCVNRSHPLLGAPMITPVCHPENNEADTPQDLLLVPVVDRL